MAVSYHYSIKVIKRRVFALIVVVRRRTGDFAETLEKQHILQTQTGRHRMKTINYYKQYCRNCYARHIAVL